MSDKTIWKFDVPVADEVEVLMPRHSTILSIQASPDPSVLWCWAVVNPAFTEAPRTLSIRGTGHPLGDVGEHFATVQAPPFVWHVFEAVDPR